MSINAVHIAYLFALYLKKGEREVNMYAHFHSAKRLAQYYKYVHRNIIALYSEVVRN